MSHSIEQRPSPACSVGNSLTLGEVEAKNLALEDYKKWALLEETSWRQKLREI